jgi:DUF1680 family protein
VDYPGDRPHCYTLLTVEAFVYEYLATGDARYHNAVMGAWEIYHRYYQHAGGYISIGELSGPYCAPGSTFISTYDTGETCGQVFWAWINQVLMQLYPQEEKYTAQVEEVLYNTLIPGKAAGGGGNVGNVGYLSLHGKKGGVGNVNGCCQVSACMTGSAIPQWIYMTGETAVYVNLFAASVFDSPFGKITMETEFPYSGKVDIRVEPLPGASRFELSIRAPCWARSDVDVYVNGAFISSGKSGERVAVNRHWQAGDSVSFTLPVEPRLIKYTGADQSPDGKSRYTMLYGPVLMAYTDPLCTGGGYIPHIALEPDELLKRLKNNPGKTGIPGGALRLAVPGTDNAFVPYWEAPDEGFSCVPVIGK